MRFVRNGLAVSTLSFALALPMSLYAQAPANGQDAKVLESVQKSLDKSRFSNVKVNVSGGVVTLSGQVDRYSDKEEADKKAHHGKEIVAVRNMIQVAGGGEVSDAVLQGKLSKKLTYDRVGYGTTMFNDIHLNVQNGVVTVAGTVYGPTDKSSALGVIADTPGVRDVVDDLKVAPLSPMDDRIRIAEARAIYGYPSLNRYAIDPAKTIRITVVNGHVSLNGVVDTKSDRDVAGIRANGVPGVFSVTNNLQVAGQVAQR